MLLKNMLCIRARLYRLLKNPCLYQGTSLHVAKKLMLCIRARFYRLRKNSCFVSGHDFSRAVTPRLMRALAAATEGRTDVFPRGIRLAPEVFALLPGAEFFRSLFSRALIQSMSFFSSLLVWVGCNHAVLFDINPIRPFPRFCGRKGSIVVQEIMGGEFLLKERPRS
jgi:hypothetical protein